MRRGLVRDTLQHGLGRGPSSETRFLPFNIQRHSFNSYKLKAYCVREEPRACPGVGTSPDGIFLVARPRTHRIAEQSPGLSQVSLCDLWQGVAASGPPSLSFPGLPPPLTWILTSSAPRGSCFQQLQPPPSSSWLLASYPDQPDQPEAPGCSALTSCAQEPTSMAGSGHMALPSWPGPR